MLSISPFFERLEQTATIIAQHADSASKQQAVKECLDNMEDRWRQGQLTPGQRSRIVAILFRGRTHRPGRSRKDGTVVRANDRMSDFFNRLLGRDDPPRDRRRSPRSPTLTNCACLAWHERGRTHISPARLLNLSRLGAFVLADEVPDQRQSARFRLEEPAPTGWVNATVVRYAGAHQVGLDFAEHCEFYKPATQAVRQFYQ